MEEEVETKCLMQVRLGYGGDFCHQELSYTGESEAKNFKKSKERVTLLACSNAAGTCRLPVKQIYMYSTLYCTF